MLHTLLVTLIYFLAMAVVKNSVADSPLSESSDSESLFVKLAKSHAENAYALVNKRYLGDAKPIFVDNTRE